MDNRVLIIGNGFDLDLGLHTSYSSFVESEYFEKLRHTSELIEQLYTNYKEKKWIDIEEELKSFAKRYGRETSKMKKNEVAFNQLADALCLYLESIDYSKIKRESIAARLLVNVIKNGYFQVLDFNYTDLERIISILGVRDKIVCKQVHGRLIDHSIILGFEDNVDILNSYYYMIKSHSPHYRSCNVRTILDNADEVVFFGHSLGSTDYHYFSDFFKQQSGLNGTNDVKKKKIRIFTFDEYSRLKLLEQLREMNERRVNYLYDLNDLQFYKTSDESDFAEIDKFFGELNQSSRDSHNRRLQEIADIVSF